MKNDDENGNAISMFGSGKKSEPSGSIGNDSKTEKKSEDKDEKSEEMT